MKRTPKSLFELSSKKKETEPNYCMIMSCWFNNAISNVYMWINFQHKKASLSSRASQEKEGRPKPVLLNMEDQVWIKYR